ncbi:hypothetical protein MMC25_000898 [Agyrium rufum]|nr:hypothetical protein [Agyrium rufum]
MDYLAYAKQVYQPPPQGAPYSLPLPGTEQKDRSPVYRHWRFTDKLLDTLDPHVLTGHEMFEKAAQQVPRNKCLGWRPYDPVKKTFGNYVWMDFQTVARRRNAFGAGIAEVHRQIGITDEKYGVGLWCQNRPEWQLTDLGCMSQSLFSVSLYDTLGPSAVEYIIQHASLACVVTSLNHIPVLLKLKPRLPLLKIIICVDPLSAGEQAGHSKAELLNAIAAEVGIKIYDLEQVEAIGEKLGSPVKLPSPDDIITINYTSGTTGPPKGVTLTHRAAVAGCSASLCTIIQGHNDVGISYLPLAHIYGRMSEQGGLWAGGAIGYFHGDVLALVDDMKLLRPTLFLSVPRLYNRFGGAIRAATLEAPGIRGALSRHVVATKTAAIQNPDAPGATNKHLLYDRIWGKKVNAALGLDRTQGMVSGSAPIDPSLHTFLRVVFANHFLQGWGMTETYAVGLAQIHGDHSTGNCGAPHVTSELCLTSVPDMDYLVTDKPFPRGELLIRGHNLFSGYYKAPEETAKAMTEDGWFRTGDICTIDDRGRFKIVDRVKNVLKLSHGEYISPERIENVYLSHLNWLAQAYVHGDSVQTFLVAIFGVMPELFAPFASKIVGTEIKMTDQKALEAACNDERVKTAVMKEIDKVGRKSGFMGYERVRKCRLMLDPFTIENELLTPTLKLKRPQAAKKFRTELDEMYAEGLEEERKAGGKAKL